MGEELQDMNVEDKARDHACGGCGLTAREYQVARLLAVGVRNPAIAKALAISVKTVDTHRAQVLRKLRLQNTTLLAHFALLHGWVELLP